MYNSVDMAINLREEKTVTSQVQQFSAQIGELLTVERALRKHLALLKILVSSIDTHINQIKHAANPENLIDNFAENAFPRQPAIAEAIGYDAPLEVIRNALHELKSFIANELSSRQNAVELFNTLALALQVEVVRISRKLDEEENNTNVIRQGQQMEVDDDTGEDEKEHAPLKRSHKEPLEELQKDEDEFKRSLESFAASIQQSRQEKQPVTPEEQRGKDIKDIIEERKNQNVLDNTPGSTSPRGR